MGFIGGMWVSELIKSMSLIFYLLWPFLVLKTLKVLPVMTQSVLGSLWTVLFSVLHLALLTY